MNKFSLTTLFNRTLRASRLEGHIFKEIKDDRSAVSQAFAVVSLAGLSIGTGIGLAGFFRMAGTLSIFGLLAGIVISLALWLLTAFFTWLIARIFPGTHPPRFKEILRISGFAASPGLLGILIFIPQAGGYLLALIFAWVLLTFVTGLSKALNIRFRRAAVVTITGGFALALFFTASVFVTSFLSGLSWNSGDSFDAKINAIAKSHRFSLAWWEIRNIPSTVFNLISEKIATGNDSVKMEQFFANSQSSQLTTEEVEKILEAQIKQTLESENITSFPPLNLRLMQMPRLLVISPRDRIESVREILLDPGLSTRQIQEIEQAADSLNVSSLVVELGGFGGTYPTLVANNSSLGFTVSTAVEEWLHQYLALRPLGFRYVLDLTGIKRDYEIAMINEAAAGMVSGEIGDKLLQSNYSNHTEIYYDSSNFSRQMREIRQKTDDYLSKGEVAAAEQFMEQKRQELAKQGYFIRKMNQAYFAWHGTYANQPTSVSPIGAQLRQLRSRCTSIKQFLDIVSEMTSTEDLKEALAGT